ncbi:MAG TPA: IS110 family transposase [Planctomycetaceae bacterium]|nr:IS110 family transposase [Planctomycetaceae bacterium]
MFYVGLDIHSRQITMCVLDENGKLLQRAQVRTVAELESRLRSLPDRFEVCYEASCGYGHYHDVLSPLASRVVVAHPGQLRLIFRSKHKNDRKDAEKLAKLLFLGEVPAVHVPTADVRAWRELITCRRHLVEKRTVAKNGVRALLRSLGVSAPPRPGLWTNRGVAWLRGLELSAAPALRRDLLLEEIATLTRQIRRVETELDRIGLVHPAVFQLMSIPGVGLRTAEAVVAFLDDPHRFPHSKAVGRYFGLVPVQDQSGRTNRLGHITREGSATVRRFLTEAAWQAIRRSPSVRAFFERVQRQDPERKKIAIVATAHYLVRVMYALLRHGTLWKETVQAA